MENGVDFEYEYSDLNLFHIRVKVLTGDYAGLVLEYGSSTLAQWEDKNTFVFNYILYEVPVQFDGPTLRKDSAFNEFIAYLLVDVIKSKNNDQQNLETKPSRIDIDKKYYMKGAA